MQIDEPLFPINALCFVHKPTWVFAFLVEKGEAHLTCSVQTQILIRTKIILFSSKRNKVHSNIKMASGSW